MKRLVTIAVGDPPTLAELLSARLGLAASAAVALVARGAVYASGKRLSDASASIATGTRLTVYLPDAPAPPPPLAMVYRDAWLLVVDKPAGQPSQATRADAASALDAEVQRAFPEARMMHRLDRDASGLVLFAASPQARAPLQRALEAGEIERSYLARVAGRLDGEGRIALRIARDPRDERRRVAHPETSTAGQHAASRYRTLRHGAASTAVELTLETGRTHQLRVHLQAIGHPIAGDRLYGGPPSGRLCLHATRLELRHPANGQPLTLLSPPPAALALDAPP